jgi:hypothetical protein
MATGVLASNYKERASKWLPYYHKPFDLGHAMNSDGSGGKNGDGDRKWITQTTGTSLADHAAIKWKAAINDETNCGYIYEIIYETSSTWYVKKYDSREVLVDTIYANATSGDQRFWVGYGCTFDVGMAFGVEGLSYGTTLDAGDVFRIVTPTAEELRKKRIYHGGYSTYLRYAGTAGNAYYTDIIPSNLKGKNIGVSLFNNTWLPYATVAPTNVVDLRVAGVNTLTSGNSGQDINLCWNLDVDGVISNAEADFNENGWTSSGNNSWQLGTRIADDVDFVHTGVGTGASFINLASSDVEWTSGISGFTQALNITVSGRAGYARIVTAFDEAAGTESTQANNQFIPIILTIS